MPRDVQQTRFYKFEDDMVRQFLPPDLGDGLSLHESTDLIRKICTSYGVKPPTVREGWSNKKAHYQPIRHHVVLPPWAQRSCVVVHETVHALVRGKGHNGASHDGVYIRAWIEVWSRMYSIEETVLIGLARRAGLDVAETSILRQGVCA